MSPKKGSLPPKLVTKKQLEEEGWKVKFAYGLPSSKFSPDHKIERRQQEEIVFSHTPSPLAAKDNQSLWKHSYLFKPSEFRGKEGWNRVFSLVQDEVINDIVDYPLTSVISAFEKEENLPLLQGIWKFPDTKGIRAVSVQMKLDPLDIGESTTCDEILRACYIPSMRIPPKKERLGEFTKEYLTTRLMVLHELGHHVLHRRKFSDISAEDLSRQSMSRLEQEADLFALMMSAQRGWPRIVSFDYDELKGMAKELELENLEQKVDACMKKRNSSRRPQFPHPSEVFRYAKKRTYIEETPRKPVLLSYSRMDEIRKKVAELLNKTSPSTLTWAARAISARKSDMHITFRHAQKSEEIHDVRSSSRYFHGAVEGAQGIEKFWQEYDISFPLSHSNGGVSKGLRSRIAAHLGLIRLFEKPSWSKYKNGDHSMRKYPDQQKQVAALYGLSLETFRGKLEKHERLEMEHLRFLASKTRSGIGAIVREYDEDFFGWFVRDPDSFEAKERYIGRIVSMYDEKVICELKNSLNKFWELNLSRTSLKDAGIPLEYGKRFKAFTVEQNINDMGTLRRKLILHPLK